MSRAFKSSLFGDDTFFATSNRSFSDITAVPVHANKARGNSSYHVPSMKGETNKNKQSSYRRYYGSNGSVRNHTPTNYSQARMDQTTERAVVRRHQKHSIDEILAANSQRSTRRSSHKPSCPSTTRMTTGNTTTESLTKCTDKKKKGPAIPLKPCPRDTRPSKLVRGSLAKQETTQAKSAQDLLKAYDEIVTDDDAYLPKQYRLKTDTLEDDYKSIMTEHDSFHKRQGIPFCTGWE